MFLIIEKNYTLSKIKVLTASVRFRARQAQINVVDCKSMTGMNSPLFAEQYGGEWSEINDYVAPENTPTTESK